LALVRSEALTLVGYLRTELAPRASLRRHQGAALRASKDLSRLADEIGRRLRQEAEDPERVLDIGASAAEQLRAQVVRLAAAGGGGRLPGGPVLPPPRLAGGARPASAERPVGVRPARARRGRGAAIRLGAGHPRAGRAGGLPLLLPGRQLPAAPLRGPRGLR